MKRTALALLAALSLTSLAACNKALPPPPPVQAAAPAPAYVESAADVAIQNAPEDKTNWTPPAGAWFTPSNDQRTCAPHMTPTGFQHDIDSGGGIGGTAEETERRDSAGNVVAVDIAFTYKGTEHYTIYPTKADCLAALPAPTKWFTFDVNHAHCFASDSPADRIRDIQSDGMQATAQDLGDKVEVSYPSGSDTVVYSYYRSEAACTASLPRNQPISSQYE